MNAFADYFEPKRDEKSRELWRHWARMPLIDLHEAAALLSGVIPSKHWCHETISRKQASFGEEINEKYLRTFDLLVREKAAYNLHERNSLDAVVAWARKNGIPVSEKLTDAIEEIRIHRITTRLEDEFQTSNVAPADRELGTRERDTLLYLVAAMAIEKYGYSPKKRTTAVSQIGADLENIGVERLSDETIRNKLKKACELVPQTTFKKG
ncbi:MAG: hypothetical protein A3E78_12530 [Alphaproteobacteria bacterium RIFCSPHIGHO2_12_FULL_63_12]|nr:MAG: hypothetical protein A3E78_12530 [Alphaproteobacteria bacterium RIFCSPHIGHO2_12_FULL_63_12]